MKIYSQTIDLSKTTPQNFYVPPHSKFKLGVKLVQSIDFIVKLDGAALESDGEIDGFKTFSLESTNPGNTTYIVEAANGQKVKILQTTTNSTVFEVGGGEIPEGNFVKSVNSELPIDGNIDVSKLVWVDDGVKTELPATDIVNSLKSIDASLANKLERADIVPVAPSTDAPEEALASARATAEFVNSSIATNTANFMGTFNSESEFPAEATNNDYLFLDTVDEEGNKVFKRYKYVESSAAWKYEYTLNNSSFTAAQWAAIQSGITAEIVNNTANSLKNINDSLSHKLERADIVPIAPATDAPEEALAGARATAEFVNNSIATNTAHFTGTYTSESAFPAEATNNDYLFLDTVDSDGNKILKVYQYAADSSRWAYMYTLNNSSFTAAQWAAIQSGITAEIVNNTANSLKNINDSLSHKLERADIVPIAPATDAPEEALAGARATAEFVNSSIATNTANFMGTFTNPDDFPKEATNNDYLFFDTVDEEGNKIFQRYKYTVTDYEGTTGWKYEYTLNNSSFTAAQWATIQSGITAEDVADMAKKSELDAHTVVLSGEFEDGTTFNYTVYTK